MIDNSTHNVNTTSDNSTGDTSTGVNINAGTTTAGSSDEAAFRYEPVERFGASMTGDLPWNTTALAGVERLNGRVAMLGFLAAIIAERLTGEGIVGQLRLYLLWILG